MFSGNIELSYRKSPHVQLIKGKALTGYPIFKQNNEACIKVVHLDNFHAEIKISATYRRNGFYQLKWWMMIPFSEYVTLDDDPINIYMNIAKDIAGLEYGEHWTRVKFTHPKPETTVQVGIYRFTVKSGDVKDLMIYRRLDNQLIELSWIFWNTDRHGVIPHKTFYSTVELYVKEGFPSEEQTPLLTRGYRKIMRSLRKKEWI